MKFLPKTEFPSSLNPFMERRVLFEHPDDEDLWGFPSSRSEESESGLELESRLKEELRKKYINMYPGYFGNDNNKEALEERIEEFIDGIGSLLNEKTYDEILSQKFETQHTGFRGAMASRENIFKGSFPQGVSIPLNTLDPSIPDREEIISFLSANGYSFTQRHEDTPGIQIFKPDGKKSASECGLKKIWPEKNSEGIITQLVVLDGDGDVAVFPESKKIANVSDIEKTTSDTSDKVSSATKEPRKHFQFNPKVRKKVRGRVNFPESIKPPKEILSNLSSTKNNNEEHIEKTPKDPLENIPIPEIHTSHTIPIVENDNEITNESQPPKESYIPRNLSNLFRSGIKNAGGDILDPNSLGDGVISIAADELNEDEIKFLKQIPHLKIILNYLEEIPEELKNIEYLVAEKLSVPLNFEDFPNLKSVSTNTKFSVDIEGYEVGDETITKDNRNNFGYVGGEIIKLAEDPVDTNQTESDIIDELLSSIPVADTESVLPEIIDDSDILPVLIAEETEEELKPKEPDTNLKESSETESYNPEKFSAEFKNSINWDDYEEDPCPKPESLPNMFRDYGFKPPLNGLDFDGDSLNNDEIAFLERVPNLHLHLRHDIEIPESLNNLEGLSSDSIKRIPHFLVNLKKLQTSSATEIPPSLTELIYLEAESATEIPNTLKNLKTLYAHSATEIPGDFENLEDLIADSATEIPNTLKNLKRLRANSATEIPDSLENLESLEANSVTEISGSFKKLKTLKADSITEIPKSLAELTLLRANNVKSIPEELINLEILEANKAESIPEKLKNLKILNAQNLEETIEFSVFKNLERVYLTDNRFTTIIGTNVDEIKITEDNKGDFGYLGGEIIKLTDIPSSAESDEKDLNKFSDEFKEAIGIEDETIPNPETFNKEIHFKGTEFNKKEIDFLKKIPELALSAHYVESIPEEFTNLTKLSTDRAASISKEFKNLKYLDAKNLLTPVMFKDFPDLDSVATTQYPEQSIVGYRLPDWDITIMSGKENEFKYIGGSIERKTTHNNPEHYYPTKFTKEFKEAIGMKDETIPDPEDLRTTDSPIVSFYGTALNNYEVHFLKKVPDLKLAAPDAEYIPASLTNLKSLFNEKAKHIPSSFVNLTSLTTVSTDVSNKFVNLTHLQANNAKSISKEFKKLKELKANSAKSIPESLVNLEWLEADSAEVIPMEFKKLKVLNANNAKSIPESLVNLKRLYADSAKSIPKELKNISYLQAKNLTTPLMLKDFPNLTDFRDFESIVGTPLYNNAEITNDNRDQFKYVSDLIVQDVLTDENPELSYSTKFTSKFKKAIGMEMEDDNVPNPKSLSNKEIEIDTEITLWTRSGDYNYEEVALNGYEIHFLKQIPQLHLNLRDATYIPESLTNLTRLKADNAKFIPKELVNLTHLNAGIAESIPKEFKNLTHLKANSAESIPEEFENLTHLDAYSAKSIPNSLVNLEDLFVSNAVIPETLHSLKSLNIKDGATINIPETLYRLETLELQYSTATIPENLPNLKNIITYDSSIPKTLTINSLENLEVYGTTTIPENLPNLKLLWAGGLESIPENFPELTKLYAEKLKSIPSSLKKLRILDADSAESIPDSLVELRELNANSAKSISDKLVNLESLTANNAESIPGTLVELKYLYAKNAKSIPDSLKKLTTLHADSAESIPSSLEKLTTLDANSAESIPDSLVNLEHLQAKNAKSIPNSLTNLEYLGANNATSIPKKLNKIRLLKAINISTPLRFKDSPDLKSVATNKRTNDDNHYGDYEDILGFEMDDGTIIKEGNRDNFGYLGGEIIRITDYSSNTDWTDYFEESEELEENPDDSSIPVPSSKGSIEGDFETENPDNFSNEFQEAIDMRDNIVPDPENLLLNEDIINFHGVEFNNAEFNNYEIHFMKKVPNLRLNAANIEHIPKALVNLELLIANSAKSIPNTFDKLNNLVANSAEDIPEEFKDLWRLKANNAESISKEFKKLEILEANNAKSIPKELTKLKNLSANSAEDIPEELVNLKELKANSAESISKEFKKLEILEANNAKSIPKELTNLKGLSANSAEDIPEELSELTYLEANSAKSISKKLTNLKELSANSAEDIPEELENLTSLEANSAKSISDRLWRLHSLTANNVELIPEEFTELDTLHANSAKFIPHTLSKLRVLEAENLEIPVRFSFFKNLKNVYIADNEKPTTIIGATVDGTEITVDNIHNFEYVGGEIRQIETVKDANETLYDPKNFSQKFREKIMWWNEERLCPEPESLMGNNDDEDLTDIYLNQDSLNDDEIKFLKRTLNPSMWATSITEIPDSLSNLIELRASSITKIPETLTKLVLLDAKNVTEIPDTLKKLKYLITFAATEIPNTLTELETLSVGAVKEIPDTLKKLKELHAGSATKIPNALTELETLTANSAKEIPNTFKKLTSLHANNAENIPKKFIELTHLRANRAKSIPEEFTKLYSLHANSVKSISNKLINIKNLEAINLEIPVRFSVFENLKSVYITDNEDSSTTTKEKYVKSDFTTIIGAVVDDEKITEKNKENFEYVGGKIRRITDDSINLDSTDNSKKERNFEIKDSDDLSNESDKTYKLVKAKPEEQNTSIEKTEEHKNFLEKYSRYIFDDLKIFFQGIIGDNTTIMTPYKLSLEDIQDFDPDRNSESFTDKTYWIQIPVNTTKENFSISFLIPKNLAQEMTKQNSNIPELLGNEIKKLVGKLKRNIQEAFDLNEHDVITIEEPSFAIPIAKPWGNNEDLNNHLKGDLSFKTPLGVGSKTYPILQIWSKEKPNDLKIEKENNVKIVPDNNPESKDNPFSNPLGFLDDILESDSNSKENKNESESKNNSTPPSEEILKEAKEKALHSTTNLKTFLEKEIDKNPRDEELNHRKKMIISIILLRLEKKINDKSSLLPDFDELKEITKDVAKSQFNSLSIDGAMSKIDEIFTEANKSKTEANKFKTRYEKIRQILIDAQKS